MFKFKIREKKDGKYHSERIRNLMIEFNKKPIWYRFRVHYKNKIWFWKLDFKHFIKRLIRPGG